MSRVLLGDVAVEHKETCKGSKDGYPIVGLEHLIPEEITLTAWDEGSENTFSKMFRKGNVLFGRRRAYLKRLLLLHLMASALAISLLSKQNLTIFCRSCSRSSSRMIICLTLLSANPQAPFHLV